MYQIYRNFMDSERNPLSALPPAQRLQAMIILSVMWSTIFCLSTANWLWYGEMVVGHMLFILGVAITALTFRAASGEKRRVAASYRDHPRRDGSARYDDVWGGSKPPYPFSACRIPSTLSLASPNSIRLFSL